MYEDRLTADQRIRLEAVAQANVSRQRTSLIDPDPANVDRLVDDAEVLENYIRNGRQRP